MAEAGPRDPEGDNEAIPSGYTYLGQFVDHDLTFDPASSLELQNDPHALTNFRTPRFDLDSVYGRGPADQPYLYDAKNPGAFLSARLPAPHRRRGDARRHPAPARQTRFR